MKNENVRSQKGNFTVDENRIIHADYDKSVHIILEDAQKEVAFAAEVGGGQKVLSIVDISNVKSVEQKARRYYSGVEAGRAYKAVALVVNSPISKMLGNFFLGLNKPPMPTKLFNSKEEGIAWLKGFKL